MKSETKLNQSKNETDVGLDGVKRFAATQRPEGIKTVSLPFWQGVKKELFRSGPPRSVTYEASSSLLEMRAHVERQVPPAVSHLRDRLKHVGHMLNEAFDGLPEPEAPAFIKPRGPAITLAQAREAIQTYRAMLQESPDSAK